jgi:hypothetical protein
MNEALDDTAQRLIENAFADIEPENLVDYHLHTLSLGTGLKAICGKSGSTNAYVNPARFEWTTPIWKIKASVIISAARIRDRAKADEQ